MLVKDTMIKLKKQKVNNFFNNFFLEIASERMILTLLKTEYAKQTCHIIENEYRQINEANDLRDESTSKKITEIDKIENNKIKKKEENSNVINLNDSFNKELKKDKLNKNNYTTTLEEKIALHFEIFCFKWERFLLLSFEENNYIKNTIKLIKENLTNISKYTIGSYMTKTIRSNFKEIDILCEYDSRQNFRDEIINVSIKALQEKMIDFIISLLKNKLEEGKCQWIGDNVNNLK